MAQEYKPPGLERRALAFLKRYPFVAAILAVAALALIIWAPWARSSSAETVAGPKSPNQVPSGYLGVGDETQAKTTSPNEVTRPRANEKAVPNLSEGGARQAATQVDRSPAVEIPSPQEALSLKQREDEAWDAYRALSRTPGAQENLLRNCEREHGITPPIQWVTFDYRGVACIYEWAGVRSYDEYVALHKEDIEKYLADLKRREQMLNYRPQVTFEKPKVNDFNDQLIAAQNDFVRMPDEERKALLENCAEKHNLHIPKNHPNLRGPIFAPCYWEAELNFPFCKGVEHRHGQNAELGGAKIDMPYFESLARACPDLKLITK